MFFTHSRFLLVFLVQFMMQLINLDHGLLQGSSAGCGNPGHPSSSADQVSRFDFRRPPCSIPLEERVKRTWPDAVAMVFKLIMARPKIGSCHSLHVLSRGWEG